MYELTIDLMVIPSSVGVYSILIYGLRFKISLQYEDLAYNQPSVRYL